MAIPFPLEVKPRKPLNLHPLSRKGSNKNGTNPWIELTLENWLARKGSPRAYILMVKLVLKPHGTLGS